MKPAIASLALIAAGVVAWSAAPAQNPIHYPVQNNDPIKRVIVYGADPDAFGVSAYLYAEANGGAKFIRQILAKEVPFGTGEFEFYWSK